MMRDLPSNFQMFVQMVCASAGYQRVVDYEMVVDHQSYFDICHCIFAQLRIKIAKIEQRNDIQPGQKLQGLINLLIQELKLDQDMQLGISGHEIVKGNFQHTGRLIQILFQYSNIYVEDNVLVKKVRSQKEQKNSYSQRPAFKSARDPRKSQENNEQKDVNPQYLQPNKGYLPKKPNPHDIPINRSQPINHYQSQNHYYEHSRNHAQPPKKYQQHQNQYYENSNRQELRKNHSQYQKRGKNNPDSESNQYQYAQNKSQAKQKVKKKKPKYNTQSKRARSQQQQRKNVFGQIANIILKQKGKMLQAATTDNRKSRLSSVKQAKSAYKIYLKRFAKDNKVERNRQANLKERSKAKQPNHQLDIKDFDNIDSFFQSFACQFRDKKAAYLKNIQKMVHKQQLDRFYFQNRLERQLKKQMNDNLQHELERSKNQHKVRTTLIKQSAKQLQNKTNSMQKELKARDSKNKKDLKNQKIKQLKKIQNILKEDNERAMMIFEDGGRLEQIIAQMYKRF